MRSAISPHYAWRQNGNAAVPAMPAMAKREKGGLISMGMAIGIGKVKWYGSFTIVMLIGCQIQWL